MLLELCELQCCLVVMCDRGLLRTIFITVLTLIKFLCELISSTIFHGIMRFINEMTCVKGAMQVKVMISRGPGLEEGTEN